MFEAKWRSERIQPRNDPYFHIHKNRDNNVVFDSGFWRCWVKSWPAQNRQVQCHRSNKGLTALLLEGTADDAAHTYKSGRKFWLTEQKFSTWLCACVPETLRTQSILRRHSCHFPVKPRHNWDTTSSSWGGACWLAKLNPPVPLISIIRNGLYNLNFTLCCPWKREHVILHPKCKGQNGKLV